MVSSSSTDLVGTKSMLCPTGSIIVSIYFNYPHQLYNIMVCNKELRISEIMLQERNTGLNGSLCAIPDCNLPLCQNFIQIIFTFPIYTNFSKYNVSEKSFFNVIYTSNFDISCMEKWVPRQNRQRSKIHQVFNLV